MVLRLAQLRDLALAFNNVAACKAISQHDNLEHQLMCMHYC